MCSTDVIMIYPLEELLEEKSGFGVILWKSLMNVTKGFDQVKQVSRSLKSL